MRVMFFLIGCLLSCNAIAASTISKASIFQNETCTYIKFHLSHLAHYHIFALSNPRRLVLDLKNVNTKTSLNALTNNSNLLHSLHYHRRNNHDLRIVFNIKMPIIAKIKELNNPPTLYLEMRHRYAPVYNEKQDVFESIFQKKTTHQKNVVVVIDPGHGGKDPGASGPRHSHEKDIVLAISKALALKLNSIPGVQAIMTRNDDRYISLRGRLHFARRMHANLFLAIHADAYRDHTAHGVSVYALSKRGATSEAARWLANKENVSELMGGANLRDKSYLLRSVLLDLSLTATINSSLTFGKSVLDHLSQISKEHYSRVEQARFVVLKSPDIPSILVETGFLSNYHEESRLRAPHYQQLLAQAIAQGVYGYLLQFPPPYSYLAQHSAHSHLYKVRRGDTLRGIAKRYHTTVNSLKLSNGLMHPLLHVGQQLRIPS